jgi:hypothetical protein
MFLLITALSFQVLGAMLRLLVPGQWLSLSCAVMVRPNFKTGLYKKDPD